MNTTQAVSLPIAALCIALTQRKPNAGVIFHSDQGSVYASVDYRELMELHGVLPGMSREGNLTRQRGYRKLLLQLEERSHL